MYGTSKGMFTHSKPSKIGGGCSKPIVLDAGVLVWLGNIFSQNNASLLEPALYFAGNIYSYLSDCQDQSYNILNTIFQYKITKGCSDKNETL